jgi:hypothetical protein
MKFSAAEARKRLDANREIARAKEREAKRAAAKLAKEREAEKERRLKEREAEKERILKEQKAIADQKKEEEEALERYKRASQVYIDQVCKKSLSQAIEGKHSLKLGNSIRYQSQTYDINPFELRSIFLTLGYDLIKEESFGNKLLLTVIKELNHEAISTFFTLMKSSLIGIEKVAKEYQLTKLKDLLKKYRPEKKLEQNVLTLLAVLYSVNHWAFYEDWEEYGDTYDYDAFLRIEAELEPLEIFFNHYEKYGLINNDLSCEFFLNWKNKKTLDKQRNFPNGYICNWISSSDGQKFLSYVFKDIENQISRLKNKSRLNIQELKKLNYACFNEKDATIKLLIPISLQDLIKIFVALGYNCSIASNKKDLSISYVDLSWT